MDLTSILDESDDVRVAWNKFQDAFLEATEKWIPKGKIRKENLPWLTKDLMKIRSIAPVITKLLNMSIASGKLSKDWKSSLVVAIPKKT